MYNLYCNKKHLFNRVFNTITIKKTEFKKKKRKVVSRKWKKILKTALFSSAVIASTTVGLTTVSCGAKTPDSHYKTQKELEVIFNKSNLTTPITKVITQRFVTKDVTKPVISDTSFKTSLIRDTEIYNPEVNISGSFEYSPSPKNNITNIFSLIISYDEKNSIYQSSFININTIANNNIDPILNGPMACSKWNNAVMTKMNYQKLNDFKVSQVNLTNLVSYNVTKVKGDRIISAYYKGTLVKFGKQQVVSVEVVYNATKGTGQVTQAFMPFVINGDNVYYAGNGKKLFNLLFPALKKQVEKNWTGTFFRAIYDKNLTVNITNKNSLTATNLTVSGDMNTYTNDADSNTKGQIPAHFVAKISYDFRTLKYTMDPNKDIKITPNDRMLLGHDQVVAAVKARFNNTTDTLNSFEVQSFVIKTDTQPAYANVVGWLTTNKNISKIFYMEVILKDNTPWAEAYISMATNAPFANLSTNGTLYKKVLPAVKNIKNFAKLTITKADKSIFTDKTWSPYNSKTTIYFNVTLKDGTVVKYSASVLYEFDFNFWRVYTPTIVK